MCAPSSTTSIAVSHSGHLRPAFWLLSNMLLFCVHVAMWPCDCAVVRVVRMPNIRCLTYCGYVTMALRCCSVVVLRCCGAVVLCQWTHPRATHLRSRISACQHYPRVPPPSLVMEPNEAARAHECVTATKTSHPLVRVADDA